MSNPASVDGFAVLPLWQNLTEELADIYDAHGVCATVASLLSRATGVTTIVGLTSQFTDYFDVWVSSYNGYVEQARWPVGRTSFEPFLEANASLRLDKEQVSPAVHMGSRLWSLVDGEVLGLRLPFHRDRDGAAPPGVLCVVDPGSSPLFQQAQFESLGIHITAFLERAYLRQQTVKQDVEFEIISDISLSLSRTLNMQLVFEQLSEAVRSLLNVEAVSVGLIEPDSQEIVFMSSGRGLPQNRDLPPIRLKQGQGIAGWVIERGEPQIVNDTYGDKRFYPDADGITGFHTRSMICVPLILEKQVTGVLQAINKRGGDFTEHERQLLEAISGSLAAAIANSSLHATVLAEKQRIQATFASMSEGLLTVDAHGRVTAANDALLLMLRRDLSSIVGDSANRVVRLRDGDFAEFMAEVMIAGNEHHQLAGEVLQGEQHWLPVLMSGAPIQIEEDEPNEAIFVFSDLSQIREVERMRDDFFHNIVHEFRTPLASILMYARLIRGKAKDDPEKIDRFMGIIERESDRLQNMVRQTLQLAKLDAREIQRSPEMIDLNEIFDELIPPMADQATEKGLVFIYRVEPDLPAIYGHREMLYAVFKNLIENAIKFTLAGKVRLDVAVEGNMIRAKVQDEGIGIPEAALPNLFKRFYRARTAVEKGIAGTGLGLFVVKDGIDKHQGELTVNSAEGEGTTFVVKLPCQQGARSLS